MLKKIESLREKPKHVRNQYAFYGAFVVTGLILALWVVSVPSRFQTPEEMAEDVSNDEGGFTRAFDDIKSNFVASVGSLQDDIPEEFLATTTEDVEPDERYTIDIGAMFATSSEETPSTATTTELLKNDVKVAAPVKERYILIGTSSASSASSTR